MQAAIKNVLSNEVLSQLRSSLSENNMDACQEMIDKVKRCFSDKDRPALVLIDLRDEKASDLSHLAVQDCTEQLAQSDIKANQNEVPHITKREKEVLALIIKGLSYSEISKALVMSLHTTNTHIKNIYKKLKVSSRGEATFEAMQLGLVELSHH